MIETVNERRQFVLTIIKESNDGVKGADIRETLGMDGPSFSHFMKRLMLDDTHIRPVRMGRFVGYTYDDTVVPVEDSVVMEEKTEVKETEAETPTLISKEERTSRYGDGRNHEGYSDPVVTAALMSKGELGIEMLPGEIWELKNENKDYVTKQKVVVLKKFNSCVTCLIMHDDPGVLYDSERVMCKSINVRGKMRMVNVVRILTKNVRCFNDTPVDILSPENLKLIRGYVGEHLGIEGVGVQTVTIEKPVIKRVEVPVKVEKEPVKPEPANVETASAKGNDTVMISALELAVLRNSLEIYKDLCERMAGNR